MRKILTFCFIFMSLSIFTGCDWKYAPIGTLDSDTDSDGDGNRNPQDDDKPGVRVNDLEKEVFRRINNLRVENSRKKLKWIDQAIIEAQNHAEYMADEKEVILIPAEREKRIEKIEQRELIEIEKYHELAGVRSGAGLQPALVVNTWSSDTNQRNKLLDPNLTHIGIGQDKTPESMNYFMVILLKKKKD